MTHVDVLDSERSAAYASRVFALYDTVFADFADEDAWREQMFDRHRARDGYRLVVALDDERLLGFAWGFRGERGQYWPDLVARTLPDVGAEWVGGHFEFVELAVDPAARRQGIGRRLHDALLDGLTGRALLGTSADETDPAVRLYRSCGWRTLGLLDDQRQVMGRDLRSAGRS
ncbi:MAG TPA: GNAT family N-acetyltransferase [Flexivirga sp.]|uniref:GNAT family N-acetyltransferase n=1 Tax=Flexivirga sp. TaxID=1962927 RepID=UPI002BF95A4A|nr:GNAT family N-acetyltransferase [Flexivirga sp.]HWC23226.1 GNAT family N-acetyltransferase [Flexivirga sp.]